MQKFLQRNSVSPIGIKPYIHFEQREVCVLFLMYFMISEQGVACSSQRFL